MHLQGKRLRIIPKPPPQEEEVEEEELEEDELDEDEQMEEEDVANSNIGGNTENDKEKNQKIMVKHILSKRTRVRPRPGFQGENQVLSYRQTFNYMRDNMYRQQNQADLQYVKLNNKKPSTGRGGIAVNGFVRPDRFTISLGLPFGSGL